ncbi:MAG: tRNA pseudouridine(38-40) synthase TruA [Flavobacteriaceae bacterium]
MRYFISLAYKGTDFHGWQLQPNALSVQQVLQEALQTMLRLPISIVGAGRTDAGVHASQFFAHFDFENEIDAKELVLKMNAFLPDTVVVYTIFKATNDAHARFDAKSRSYEYRIFLGRNPFLNDTAWQIHNQKINVAAMNEAAKYLLAYKDFKCFSKTKTDVKTYLCDVTEAYWKQEGNNLTFYITANRFLRNMVRAIVGTLIDIGLEKNTPQSIKDVIESRNRKKAGFSVPAKGLFLTEITYPNDIFM